MASLPKGSLLGVVFGGLLLALWVPQAGQRDDSLARVQRAGVIEIGYAVEAPFSFATPSGEADGEGPAVARHVVQRLGIPRVAWRRAHFDDLIGELLDGRIDVIAAGMFVTEERARDVAFTVPTFFVREGLLVPRGNPRGLHAFEDVVRVPALRVAAIAGSVEVNLLKQLGAPDRQILKVPDALTGRRSVETGVADAFALSAFTAAWMSAHDPAQRTEAAVPFRQPAPAGAAIPRVGAFALRKGDRALREAFDRELREFIGTPEHLALVEPFGFGPADVPAAAGHEGAAP